MTTKKIPAKAPREPAEGAAAAPLRGGFYAVRPGRPGNGPEHFGPTLDGMGTAISRAAFLSLCGPQEVISHRSRRPEKIIFRYDGGICTARPECVIPARREAP
jgi:hypothetical protein